MILGTMAFAAKSGRNPLPARGTGGSIGFLEDPGMKTFNAVRAAGAMGALAASQFAFGPEAAAQSTSAVQWRVQDGGNGHWYALNTANLQWLDARAEARSRGGDLASLESLPEITALKSMLCPSASGPCSSIHVGGIQEETATDITGGWRWLSGAPVTSILPFSMNDSPCNSGGFGENHEQDYLHLRNWDAFGDVNNGAFGGSCPASASAYASLIEWSADCNGDGIVDYGQCRDGSLPDYDGDNVPDCCEQGVACVVGTYPVEWTIADGGNGHWYRGRAFQSVTSWSIAEFTAKSLGGYLATGTGSAEAAMLFRVSGHPSLWNSRFGPWLGGYQDTAAPDFAEPAGGWRWVTGEAWFENWGASEPNNVGGNENHLHFITSFEKGIPARRWNDFPGNGGGYVKACIIEWSADCDSDGIVDYGQILRGERPDANANGVPDGCECLADLNSDGYIQGADLGLMLSSWGTAPAGTAADVNRDGAVDGNDLGLLLAAWGPCGS